MLSAVQQAAVTRVAAALWLASLGSLKRRVTYYPWRK
jgi:hypothetical protein